MTGAATSANRLLTGGGAVGQARMAQVMERPDGVDLQAGGHRFDPGTLHFRIRLETQHRGDLIAELGNRLEGVATPPKALARPPS